MKFQHFSRNFSVISFDLFHFLLKNLLLSSFYVFFLPPAFSSAYPLQHRRSYGIHRKLRCVCKSPRWNVALYLYVWVCVCVNNVNIFAIFHHFFLFFFRSHLSSRRFRIICSVVEHFHFHCHFRFRWFVGGGAGCFRKWLLKNVARS